MKRNVLGLLAAIAAGALGATADAQVKISQVYGGGGATTGTPTYTHDYVELLNTGAAVDINGWSLQYAASTGSMWSGAGLTVLATTSTILQPGQYFLVRLGTATGAIGGTIPVTQDATGTTSASATSGKFALVTNSTALTGTCPTGGAIVDFIGYGTTANCREGGAATADNAPDPSSSAFGLQRLNGGCFDSDRNRFDFVTVQNIVPKNTASPFAVCPVATDLSIAVTGGGPCPTTIGAAVSYTFTVTNAFGGASDATVTINIPSGFTFVSSTPAGTFALNTLTVALGSIPSGGTANVQVDLTTAAAGSYALTGSVASSVSDPVAINNTVDSIAAFSTPTTAAIQALYTNFASLSNSNVPTVVSAPSQFFFSTTTSQDIFGRPWLSGDGNWLMFKGRSNLATTLDDVLVRVNVGASSATTVVQEGITDLGGGELVGVLDFHPSVNNSGDYAYSTATNAVATANDVAVKNIGGVTTVMGREGSSDAFGLTIAISVTSWTMQNNGDALWGHLLASGAANDLESLIVNSATDVLAARANDSATTPAPTNQVGNTAFLWKLFNSGADLGQINQRSPDGAHTLLHGDLEGGTTDPDAAAVDGAIVLMDGQTVGSVPGTINTISSVTLRGADWIGYGSNTTGDDWVVHNGAVVAAIGQPIVPGSTELWGDSSFAATFFLAVNNSTGDYVVGGVTTAADPNANAVFVLNGTTVVVRENDAIDLNGDGTYNEDALLRTFRDDRGYLTDGRVLYFALETRDTAGYCAGNAKTGDALARLQLGSASGACCCGSSCSATTAAGCTGANTSFSGVGSVCNAFPSSLAPCCLADYNHVGGITVQDIFDFLSGYFGGNGCADINGGGISVQDIFDFLSSYFAAGC